MTPRDLIALTGLSQVEAARVVNVPLRTVQSWCSTNRMPEPARKIFVLIAADPSLLERVRAA